MNTRDGDDDDDDDDFFFEARFDFFFGALRSCEDESSSAPLVAVDLRFRAVGALSEDAAVGAAAAAAVVSVAVDVVFVCGTSLTVAADFIDRVARGGMTWREERCVLLTWSRGGVQSDGGERTNE